MKDKTKQIMLCNMSKQDYKKHEEKLHNIIDEFIVYEVYGHKQKRGELVSIFNVAGLGKVIITRKDKTTICITLAE